MWGLLQWIKHGEACFIHRGWMDSKKCLSVCSFVFLGPLRKLVGADAWSPNWDPQRIRILWQCVLWAWSKKEKTESKCEHTHTHSKQQTLTMSRDRTNRKMYFWRSFRSRRTHSRCKRKTKMYRFARVLTHTHNTAYREYASEHCHDCQWGEQWYIIDWLPLQNITLQNNVLQQ